MAFNGILRTWAGAPTKGQFWPGPKGLLPNQKPPNDLSARDIKLEGISWLKVASPVLLPLIAIIARRTRNIRGIFDTLFTLTVKFAGNCCCSLGNDGLERRSGLIVCQQREQSLLFRSVLDHVKLASSGAFTGWRKLQTLYCFQRFAAWFLFHANLFLELMQDVAVSIFAVYFLLPFPFYF